MTTPPMPTPLVIIRCKRCRKPLGSLDTMPDDWSGYLTVKRCANCVMEPESHRFVDALREQGLAGFARALDIPLADLRPHATNAKALGHPIHVDVPPSLKPRRER
jgi:hypothetical protein